MMTSIAAAVLRKSKEEIAKQVLTSAAVSAGIDMLLSARQDEDILKEGAIGATTGAAGAAVKEALEYYGKGSPKMRVVAGIGASLMTRSALRRAENHLSEDEDE